MSFGLSVAPEPALRLGQKRKVKMKRTLKFGAGLALAAFLTTAANASLYYFGPPVPMPIAGDGPFAAGQLDYDGFTVDSFSFTLSTLKGNVLGADTSFSGTVSVLADGNLVLVGLSSGDLSATWTIIPGNGKTPDVDQAILNSGSDPGFTFSGVWIPVTVPEPTTLIAGALLLLPFGAGALRMLRKTRTI